MGLLDKLWDYTHVGTPPDSGVGRLRKYATFSAPSNSNKEGVAVTSRSSGDDDAEEGTRVTRSIMIIKPPGYQLSSGSLPASPAGSTPQSPLPFPGKESFRFRRRSTSDAYEKARGEDAGAGGSTPPCDV